MATTPSVDLRRRVCSAISEGLSFHEAAARFNVSVASAIRAALQPAQQALRAHQRPHHHKPQLQRMDWRVRGLQNDHIFARPPYPPLPYPTGNDSFRFKEPERKTPQQLDPCPATRDITSTQVNSRNSTNTCSRLDSALKMAPFERDRHHPAYSNTGKTDYGC